MPDGQILPANNAPIVKMVRHELKSRHLTVQAHSYVTPNMIRITLTGEDLADFTSLASDDHVKLFVEGPDGTAMRDYTPRSYWAESQELVLDFAVHDAGPATAWALQAKRGDSVDIGGPRASRIITGDIACWVLIGDETALPAIARRMEESPAGTRIHAIISVPTEADKQVITTAADAGITWLVREASPAHTDILLDHVRTIDIPARSFIWIAAEGGETRTLRAHLLEERGHPKQWMKASGYWVRGKPDTTEKFD